MRRHALLLSRRADLRVRSSRPAEETVASRRRRVQPERVERLIDGIVRRLESGGGTEVASQATCGAVMQALEAPDDIGSMRYASVRRGLREARGGEEILGSLAGEEAEESRARRAEAG